MNKLLLRLLCLTPVAASALAGESMHVVSKSPDKRFAVVVENWHPAGNPDSEQKQSHCYLIETETKKRVYDLEDVAGEVSAYWNPRSDGVIVFFHYDRINGGYALRAKRNILGRLKLPFYQVWPDGLEKFLPRDADPGTGVWSFEVFGWTRNGDLKLSAFVGSKYHPERTDSDSEGYELHVRFDRNNRWKVVRVRKVANSDALSSNG